MTFFLFVHNRCCTFRAFLLRSFRPLLHQVSQDYVLTSWLVFTARLIQCPFCGCTHSKYCLRLGLRTITDVVFVFIFATKALCACLLAAAFTQHLSFSHKTDVSTMFCNPPGVVHNFYLTFPAKYNPSLSSISSIKSFSLLFSLRAFHGCAQKTRSLETSMNVAFHYRFDLFSLQCLNLFRHPTCRRTNICALSSYIFSYFCLPVRSSVLLCVRLHVTLPIIVNSFSRSSLLWSRCPYHGR